MDAELLQKMIVKSQTELQQLMTPKFIEVALSTAQDTRIWTKARENPSEHFAANGVRLPKDIDLTLTPIGITLRCFMFCRWIEIPLPNGHMVRIPICQRVCLPVKV